MQKDNSRHLKGPFGGPTSEHNRDGLIQFRYMNHAGKIEDRLVKPVALVWQDAPGLHQPGWVLNAINEDGNLRSFALDHIILPDRKNFVLVDMSKL